MYDLYLLIFDNEVAEEASANFNTLLNESIAGNIGRFNLLNQQWRQFPFFHRFSQIYFILYRIMIIFLRHDNFISVVRKAAFQNGLY